MLSNPAKLLRDLVKSTVPKSFEGSFPSISDEGVLFTDDSSTIIIRHFGGPSENIIMPLVRVTVRNVSKETAGELLNTIQELLDGYQDGAFGVVLYSTERYLGRDEQKFHQMEVYYKLIEKE